MKELYPSEDPLNSLLTWPLPLREKIVKALKPYIAIQSSPYATKWNGELIWLVKPIEQGDQLSEDIERLARAAAYEYFGIDIEFRLRDDEAEDLADGIIGAGKNAL